MEKHLIEEIAEEVKSNDGSNSYDTWGNPERSNKFHQLKYYILDRGMNSFESNNEIFIVIFRNSNGITSMGGSPDSILVQSLKLI